MLGQNLWRMLKGTPVRRWKRANEDVTPMYMAGVPASALTVREEDIMRLDRYPRIGIVLVNYNSYDDTVLCLRSLASITYPNAEIIVVDNASRDESGPRLAKDFPGVTHILSAKNTGFTGGNNLGIDHALANDCEHVLLLNNDTIVTPNFLEPLVAQLESNARVAAVSGKIYYAP